MSKPINSSKRIVLQNFLIINGLQGFGKSHLIKYILYNSRNEFSYGIVFTNTSFAVDSFKYVPKKFVHPEYDENVLVKFMDLQANLATQGIKKKAFLVFDDCLDDGQFKSAPFKRLITQLRHYNIYCVISTQYPNAIPPRFRTNAFQVAIFFMSTEIALKALFASYGQLFERYQDFKHYVMSSTGDFKFIFFETRGTSTNPLERYKIMKAPAKIPDFDMKFNTKIEAGERQ
jgi:hypothetical protein